MFLFQLFTLTSGQRLLLSCESSHSSDNESDESVNGSKDEIVSVSEDSTGGWWSNNQLTIVSAEGVRSESFPNTTIMFNQSWRKLHNYEIIDSINQSPFSQGLHSYTICVKWGVLIFASLFSFLLVFPDSRILVSWYPRYRDFLGQIQVLQRFFRGLKKKLSDFNFDSKI